jgi:hypothetical protein
MNSVLETAMRRRDEITSKIAEMSQELEKLEDFILVFTKLLEESPPESLHLPLEQPLSEVENSAKMEDGVQKSNLYQDAESRPRHPRVRNNPEPATVMKEVTEILRSAPAPMTRTELLGELSSRGIKIGGQDPAKVLGTNIWRHMKRANDIVSLDDGYWLSARPLPQPR